MREPIFQTNYAACSSSRTVTTTRCAPPRGGDDHAVRLRRAAPRNNSWREERATDSAPRGYPPRARSIRIPRPRRAENPPPRPGTDSIAGLPGFPGFPGFPGETRFSRRYRRHRRLRSRRRGPPQEFSPEERSELLFHVLQRLVVGGGLCQVKEGWQTGQGGPGGGCWCRHAVRTRPAGRPGGA